MNRFKYLCMVAIILWPVVFIALLGRVEEYVHFQISRTFLVFPYSLAIIAMYLFSGVCFAAIASIKESYCRYKSIVAAHVIACMLALLFFMMYPYYFLDTWLSWLIPYLLPMRDINLNNMALLIGFEMYTLIRAIRLYRKRAAEQLH